MSPFQEAAEVIKFYAKKWDRVYSPGPNTEGHPSPPDELWADEGEKAREFLKKFGYVLTKEKAGTHE